VSITVSREGETSFPVSVGYSATAGTATAGLDFSPVTGTLNFAAGESIKSFTVIILDDTIVEGNETVVLRLTTFGPGALPGRTTATLTIIDDDFAPGRFVLAPTTPVNENAGSVTITVNRLSGRTGNVSVNYQTVAGNATPGEDYVATSGTLNFSDGETSRSFTVQILDDSAIEGNEFFTVRILNATGGAQIGAPDLITVTIIDNDFGPGSLDQSFTAANLSGTVRDIVLQPDGKILAVGQFFHSGNNRVNENVTRLEANGLSDAGFSIGIPPNGRVNSAYLGTDGRISFGGNFTSYGNIFRPYVGRLLTNGFSDNTFTQVAGENAEVFAVAPGGNGKVLVGGSFTTPTRGILRLNANGSLDVSFNPEGGVIGTVRDIAVQSDGRIIAVGDFTRAGPVTVRSITRFLSTGLIDSSFRPGTGANGIIRDVDLLPNGQILIAGDFTSYDGVSRGRVARLNSDGTVDQAFNPPAINGQVNAVAAFGGKVYIVGNFTQVSGMPRVRVARLNSDGTLDNAFAPGVGPDGEVLDVEVQANGMVLIAGSFTFVNGFFSPGIARLNVEQPVTIQSFSFVDGQPTIRFTTQVGVTYAIEASDDLQFWQTVDTRTATSDTMVFSDTRAASEQHRFYRVRVVTP
jgi:uncharacterized delta-60 repeat protein